MAATQQVKRKIPAIPGDLYIHGVRFDAYHYDEKADVLYLHVMDDRPRHDGYDDTAEGDAILYALDGTAHDAILIDPRWKLERYGRLDITPCEGDGSTETIPRALLEAMLVDTPMR
jgi:hypothetical protein